MEISNLFNKDIREILISKIVKKIRKIYLLNDSSNFFIKICIRSFYKETNTFLLKSSQKNFCCITGKKNIREKDYLKLKSMFLNKEKVSSGFIDHIVKIYSLKSDETIDSLFLYISNTGITDKKISLVSLLALRKFVDEEVSNGNNDIIKILEEIDDNYNFNKIQQLLEKYKK